jgi:hypothetical protein
MNSFYFYFGLNEGNTAIDKFNKMYYAECFKNKKYPFGILVDVKPPKWCIESDSDYSPDPRYGDHIPLANVENKSSEAKPEEAVNKGSDNDGENDILMTATPNMLAQIAEKTGNKDIFEHGIIGTYAKTYNAASYVSAFLPDLRQGLDKLGRLLFLYLWKPADFSVYYGSDDLLELEAQLSSTFRQFGELVLDLSLRTKEESINNSSSNAE